MSFGANLKRIRTEKNWSQTKLSNATGIPRQTISSYENDERIPSVYNAIDIAIALGVTVEVLGGVG